MNASDSTPPSGESVSDASVDYEQLGQTLLQSELERQGTVLNQQFLQVAEKARRGDRVDQEDLDELKKHLELARQLTVTVEEAIDDE